eukprot:scaffold200394_cov32-Tisochrysis_lutea.AAC.4
MYDGKKLPRLGDLPESVRKLWGVKLAPTRVQNAGSLTDGFAPLAHPDFQRFLEDGVVTGAIRPSNGMMQTLTNHASVTTNGTKKAVLQMASKTRQSSRPQASESSRMPLVGQQPEAGSNGRVVRGKRRADTTTPAQTAWSESGWSRSLRPRMVDNRSADLEDPTRRCCEARLR